jgi:hypothetical protein
MSRTAKRASQGLRWEEKGWGGILGREGQKLEINSFFPFFLFFSFFADLEQNRI